MCGDLAPRKRLKTLLGGLGDRGRRIQVAEIHDRTRSGRTEAPQTPEAAGQVRISDHTQANPLDAYCGRWWLVHTKSRNEKALASDLTAMRIGHFLPLIQTRHRHAGRISQTEIPLFPGYLFMCGGDDERYATLLTHRAAAVINVVDQERLRRELCHVYLVTISQESVDLYPRLCRGRRCRIVRGSLAGLEGVVLRRRGSCRIYVGVEALGQSAELEIDPALLEAVD
ncbi:MAG: transcription termination/antitermination NusG family protein [Phycisphaerae bacterium]|jgi:transcriptional antiterminator RfaH|nr:transcription termination/antitermination NusG family protein [Phycisphaerae bacterium]